MHIRTGLPQARWATGRGVPYTPVDKIVLAWAAKIGERERIEAARRAAKSAHETDWYDLLLAQIDSVGVGVDRAFIEGDYT